MDSTLARADVLVALLQTVDVELPGLDGPVKLAATVEPEVAGTRAPCVLVPPPFITEPDHGGGALVTWQLVALAGAPAGGRKAWAELDALSRAVIATLPVERAQPTAYQLPDGASHPAYVLTVTESA